MNTFYYGMGATPLPTSTRLRLLTKTLIDYQNFDGADPANDPKRNDTRRMILVKLLRSINGLALSPSP